MARIPLTVLTGFLGSGKSTLLWNLLHRNGECGDRVAILIDEYSEIGLDDRFVRDGARVPARLVASLSEVDVSRGVRAIIAECEARNGAPPDRIILETSGLADPETLVTNLSAHPYLRESVELDSVVATVDAVNARQAIARYDEALKQIALADTIILTKTDLVRDEDLPAIRAAVQALNPSAMLESSSIDQPALSRLARASGFGALASSRDAVDWLRLRKLAGQGDGAAAAHGIRTHVLETDRSVDWTAFCFWLPMLLRHHSRSVLRIKGILNVEESRGPVALHCVQGIIHPPGHLRPEEGRATTQLLFMLDKDFDTNLLAGSLDVFMRLGKNEVLGRDRLAYRPVGGGGSIQGRPVKVPSAPAWIKGLDGF